MKSSDTKPVLAIIFIALFCAFPAIRQVNLDQNITKNQSASTRTATLPGHFGIGIKNAALELTWMTASGVPWDYRYQYINPGWKDWSSPSGQFASNYTQASQENNYIPIFTWYEIGGTWFNSLTDKWNYMATPSSMNTYYTDFALLMQKIAVSTGGKPVIVQVEPDLWGLLQQNWGDDPTIIPASVASSAYAGLSGLPNNAAGFAQAMVAIRDIYAPNVILAWHASLWGPKNGYDPTLSNPAPYQTPEATGNRVVTFFQGLNASYDMVFHDPSDADSAYKVAVRHQSSNTAWWTDSAFTSYQQYIGVIYQGTGLKSMLWQVPVGNTLYISENNTNYHYQDNRAEYFLKPGNTQNIMNYVGVGVIGLLFGDGQNGATDYMDYAADGVTHPDPINGNTLVASYSDDDGGFLRTSTAVYYASINLTIIPMPNSHSNSNINP